MLLQVGLTLLSLASCQAGNIAEELTKAGATTLVDLVVKAGLADTLSNGGPFTVVAPTNEAFAKLPADLVKTVTSDVELLKKVLLFHVVEGAVTSDMIQNDMAVNSVEGSQHRVNIYLRSKFYPGFYTVNGKRLTKTDIKADNGMIHLLDEVLYPFPEGTIAEVVTKDSRFSTLLAAVKAAGLVDTLSSAGPFTVFAPTNDAFAKVPSATLNGLLADKDALTKVLLRHVIPGTIYAKGICWKEHTTAGGEMIATQVFKRGVVKVVSESAGARVVEADLLATNGVIHAIDTVI